MKVTSPLFSLDASGSIGGAIVASKWKGRNYMRRLVTPANPRSNPQVANRAMMRFLSQVWGAHVSTLESYWEELAAQGNFSPFNAFVKHNAKRWTQWQYPVALPDTETEPIPATIDTLTAIGGVGQISGTVDQNAADAESFGVAYYLNGTNNTAIAKSDLKVANAGFWGDGDPINVPYAITGLEPGTYYVKAVVLSTGGVASAVKLSAAAVVT